MNIIELLDQQYLGNTVANQLNDIDFAAILHQIEVDKITNSMVDTYLLSQLTLAITNYKEELRFILNDTILFNFFSKKEIPNNGFPAKSNPLNEDKIKSFIRVFLSQELVLFLDQNRSQDNFEKLVQLIPIYQYFPEEIILQLQQKSYDKIEFAIQTLSSPNNDLSKILYLKKTSFYDFLSHFSCAELDDKITLLLDKVLEVFMINKKSEFAGTTIVSMYNYNPTRADLLEKIKKNRNLVYDERTSSGGSTSRYSWKAAIIVLLVLVRLVFLVIKLSSNHSRNTYDNHESIAIDTIIEESPKKLDPYYVNMQRKIDSFQVFLVDYNKEEIQYAKYNDTIKTGENPFENVYKNSSLPSNGSPVFFKNKTQYDVILFENPLAFDSIKMPGRAYFIKSGSTFKLDDVPLQLHRVYNFYIGKKLASFVTHSRHIFVRNQSVMEPRFTELLPDSKAILKKDYQFDSNVTIKENKGKISITSD